MIDNLETPILTRPLPFQNLFTRQPALSFSFVVNWRTTGLIASIPTPTTFAAADFDRSCAEKNDDRQIVQRDQKIARKRRDQPQTQISLWPATYQNAQSGTFNVRSRSQ